MPLFRFLKTASGKFSLSYAFFGVLFLLRGVFGEVLGQEPRIVFLSVPGCFRLRVFVGFLYMLQGVCLAVFGFRFFGPSLSPSLFAFSSFSSGGWPGCPFFASCCCLAGLGRRTRTGPAQHAFFSISSPLLSLPGSAAFPLFLRPCPFSFFLFFLSLSLACKR